MKNIALERELRLWFKKMVSRYPWLSVKFEYSRVRGVYLVSYAPTLTIEANESFLRESMEFEDRMRELYGDEAPLFCDEERYFSLSADAELIQYQGEVVSLSYGYGLGILGGS